MWRLSCFTVVRSTMVTNCKIITNQAQLMLTTSGVGVLRASINDKFKGILEDFGKTKIGILYVENKLVCSIDISDFNDDFCCFI